MSHTPGPWEVRNNNNGTLGIDAFEPDGTRCCPAQINGDATDETYGPNVRDNARLIAAAPDLLAACEVALELLEQSNGEQTIEEYLGLAGGTYAAKVLRDAIARAAVHVEAR